MKTLQKTLLLLAIFGLCVESMTAQVAINTDGSSPDPSAILDVSSTTSGLLMPEMSRAQRLGIASPADGLIVYQNNSAAGDEVGYYFYDGSQTQWEYLNGKETYRQTVNMGSANDFEGDGTFAALPGVTTALNATGDVGVLEVTHPVINGGLIPIKVITPLYVAVTTPPAIPSELVCRADFDGNCNSQRQWSRFTGAISPPYMGAPPSPAVLATFMFCHQQLQAACDDNAGNYTYYGSDTSIPNTNGNKCFGPNQAFGVYNGAHPGLSPGDDYQLFLKGNNDNSGSNLTALSAFIDWNRDGDFFDDGEFIYTSTPQAWPTTGFGTGFITPTYVTPANAVTGPCTLRIIASRFDDNTNPCVSSPTAGSSKDYSVKVVNGATPSYPGENFYCNVQEETTTGFTVRCYTETGTPVNTKMNILIQPQ